MPLPYSPTAKKSKFAELMSVERKLVAKVPNNMVDEECRTKLRADLVNFIKRGLQCKDEAEWQETGLHRNLAVVCEWNLDDLSENGPFAYLIPEG